ncbi:hypothetical protein O6H91_19G027900 [Diphasiastrum complanatum]|uniref:Uncharacterized protein n=2 Tax=Diphasiastrum complanatum TaxID=34168 RepID=A0ACC2ATT8_DIPCM|nr:hypothetical protein O6H91_19G027900 [Diphasiastrum complanatum]KAJ7520891.1 hypothetical protein O6H91_19G027900 [Diphasiastrum complanatum]
MPPPAAAATTKAAAAVVAEKLRTAAKVVKPSGLSKPILVSAALKKFLGGQAEASRTESMRKLWEYVKSNNLQDPSNKREIICDEKLKNLFGGRERVRFLEIPGLLNAHFPKKSP